MREFFRGWRRKLGCVTLVMACVLMAVWFRTLRRDEDLLLRASPNFELYLESGEGVFFFGRIIERGVDSFTVQQYMRLPYWSIVSPLTLLSTYLLLRKPRVAKPRESTKPPDAAQVTHA